MLFTDTFSWLELSIFLCILRNKEREKAKENSDRTAEKKVDFVFGIAALLVRKYIFYI